MGSKKPSAKRKQIERFKSGLEASSSYGFGFDGFDDFGEMFERESDRVRRASAEHDAEVRRKACESKNRYAHYSDAQEALEWSEDRGRRGLRIYECPYCGGWHLTSKPER